jgi:hypothetical protein
MNAVAAHAQYRYPPPYPYGAAPRYQSELKISVKPNDASVFVDGYFAGRVDDFDGPFQELRLESGQHEITIYQPGYRPLVERLYLSPNTSRKISGRLERLLPGERDAGPPAPLYAPGERPRDRSNAPVGRARGRSGPEARGATLSIAIWPGDAAVFVDGTRYPSGRAGERLLIPILPGRHRVEVEKRGYRRYSTEIEADAGQALPLNITLTRDR